MNKAFKRLIFIGFCLLPLCFSSCSNGASDPTDNNGADEDKVYDSTSTEGRLSVEPVSDGIKVTIRLLDSDISILNSNGTRFDCFFITNTNTKIGFDLKKPRLEISDTSVSQVFPFVEKGKNYTFCYQFSINDENGEELLPDHKEYASCKATNNGLNLNSYFDFNYAPSTISLYADDMACLHLDKDVSKFFKTSDVSDVYLSGTLIRGKVDWSDSTWLNSWISKIKYSKETPYVIEASYNQMISEKGYSINKELFEKFAYTRNDNKYWGIDGTLYFTIDNKKYRMGEFKLKDANMNPVNWEKIIRTNMTYYSSDFEPLPNSVGANPFSTYTSFTFGEGSSEATLTIGGTSAQGTFALTEKNKTTPYKEGIYTWDENNKRIYCRFTKIDGKTYEETINNRPYYWESNMMAYWTFSSINEQKYTININENSIILENAEINSNNLIEKLLGRYDDGFELTGTGYKIDCGCRNIEVKVGSSYTCYVIVSIANNKLNVCEYKDTYLGPEFQIPYSFNNTTKKLTLSMDGTDYVLSYAPNTSNTGKYVINN